MAADIDSVEGCPLARTHACGQGRRGTRRAGRPHYAALVIEGLIAAWLISALLVWIAAVALGYNDGWIVTLVFLGLVAPPFAWLLLVASFLSGGPKGGDRHRPPGGRTGV